MMQKGENTPYFTFTLTALLICAAAGFFGYAVYKIQLTSGRIDVITEPVLVKGHSSCNITSNDGQGHSPGRCRLLVTTEQQEDVRNFLATGADGLNVLKSALDASNQQSLIVGKAHLLPFSVELEGPFPKVVDYLNGLDNSKWLFLTESVKITPATSASGTDVTKASIGGRLYWQ
jgi:hypothetical protein